MYVYKDVCRGDIYIQRWCMKAEVIYVYGANMWRQRWYIYTEMIYEYKSNVYMQKKCV